MKCKLDTIIRLYAIIDNQSNNTLANPRLFDLLNIHDEEIEYILTSCSGKMNTFGSRMNDIVMESIDQTVQLDIQVVNECNNLPENLQEIPTPEVA